MNDLQEKVLTKLYKYLLDFEALPEEQQKAMVKTAEFNMVLEAIKILEGIKVAYSNIKK